MFSLCSPPTSGAESATKDALKKKKDAFKWRHGFYLSIFLSPVNDTNHSIINFKRHK